MINAQFRTYNYFSFGERNSYGQPQLIKDENGKEKVVGQIKIAINTTSLNTQENINYKDAQYIGLTFGSITDKDVIDYNGEKLKVLYVNAGGRLKQVFLRLM